MKLKQLFLVSFWGISVVFIFGSPELFSISHHYPNLSNRFSQQNASQKNNLLESRTIHVPLDIPEIQIAIDEANSGDTILVEPGIYPENINFNGKDITLQSTSGPTKTFLAGKHGNDIFIGPGGKVVGFTIGKLYPSFGAGIYAFGEGIVIKNNIFEGFHETGGVGIAIDGTVTSPFIEGNIFRNNSCSNPSIQGIIDFTNQSSAVIKNNIFENNSCSVINWWLPISASPLVVNNTFYSNSLAVYIYGNLPADSKIFRNNILVKNGVGLDAHGYIPIWENNLVFENTQDYDGLVNQTGRNGNISVDPLLKSPVSHDFKLLQNSPAIDAGSDGECPKLDFREMGRPRGIHCDIGAYEFGEIFHLESINETVLENVGAFDVKVTLDETTDTTYTVYIKDTALEGINNATPEIDFMPVSSTLTFYPTSREQTARIFIFNDSLSEGDEFIHLHISDGIPSDKVFADDTLTITIKDDDGNYVYLPNMANKFCGDFYDDFSNSNSGWPSGESQFRKLEYLNGEYRFFIKQTGYFFLLHAPSCQLRTYIVESDLRWVGTEGSDIGITFGDAGDFGDFYFFDISTVYNGYALFLFKSDGEIKTIVPPTQSTVIARNSSNHLKVVRIGRHITLEINKIILGTWEDVTLTKPSNFGIALAPFDEIPYADARFDNFQITRVLTGNQVTTEKSALSNSNFTQDFNWQPNLKVLKKKIFDASMGK